MATIKDVAERAGVSTATVSYVLNGTGSVTAATKQRVLQVVAELEYQPNHAARSMRSRSRTLGLILPYGAAELSTPTLAELVAGLTEAAANHGYYLLLAGDPGTSERLVATSLARTGRVDGFVLLDLQVDDERSADLTAAGILHVGVGAPASGNACPGLSFELTGGALMATRYLRTLGHRRIALINLPSELTDSDLLYQGFAKALAETGEEVAPSFIVEAGTSQDDGLAAMQELLAQPEGPSAVLAASDELAFGAMHALRDAGIEVGRDVALIGCGDVPLAAHTHPPLTTLRAPRRALGAALARTLIALVEQQPLPSFTPLPLQLIVRKTTCPLPE
ncbi:MAG: LacI family transcriptional regulator [Chloroflexia bacterium]|nr:LacI family transcriptional regulator [Chloroflexia bacterium]